MNIHEYQAKEKMREYKVPVPEWRLITNPWEAHEAAKDLPGDQWVIKAQIHAGGRGKAGGVKLATDLTQVHDLAMSMHGRMLVTPQTGPEGKRVSKILISRAVAIKAEYYLALLIDRANRCVTVMASREGGVEIEKVAAVSPEKIIIRHVDVLGGLSPFVARGIAYSLGFTGDQVRQCVRIISALYELFVAKDCSLIEINPLILDEQDQLWAADAKINLDDNGLSRHPELRKLRDYDEEVGLETMARRYGVDYVKLNGNIGCLVNGAGLAMAIMDTIKLYDGEPANFLDIKGGAGKENVINAFKLLTADENVKSVMINIFGGIVRCDMVAAGILAALEEISVEKPIVVRLEGTNVDEGRRLLRESPHRFILADGLADAAKKAVAAARGGEQ